MQTSKCSSREVLFGIFDAGVRLGLPKPDPISDQNVPFPSTFSGLGPVSRKSR